MPCVQRYRSDPEKIVSGKIKAGKKVEIGDLCMLDPTEYVLPSQLFSVNGSGSGPAGGEAHTEFKNGFLGCLIEGATGGHETVDTPCLIGYDAVFEYPLDVAADADYPPGTLLEAVTGTGFLVQQEVKISSTAAKSFAKAAREIKQGDLTVQARLISSIMA